MRNHVFGAVALAAAVLVSGVALAGDRGPSFEEREQAQKSAFQHTTSFGYSGSSRSSDSTVNVVYLNELPKGAGTRIKSAVSAQSVQAVQASIDASAAAELRARGVQLNNVIAADKAFNGTTTYYVR